MAQAKYIQSFRQIGKHNTFMSSKSFKQQEIVQTQGCLHARKRFPAMLENNNTSNFTQKKILFSRLHFNLYLTC